MKKNSSIDIVKKFVAYTLVFSLASVLMASGCGGGGGTAICSNTSTPFKSIYSDLISASPATHFEAATLVADVQQYTFRVNNNYNVCQIGYQGNANMAASSTPYTIEIVDDATGTVLYTANHVFASTGLDYKNVTGVVVQAGRDYTIKRTAPSTVPAADNVGLGLNKNGSLLSFPLTTAGSTAFIITKTDGFGRLGPVGITNRMLPKIDIVLN